MQRLSDSAKLTYLVILVSSEAKLAITEFAYCGTMYRQALKALEAEFGQPHVVAGAHLDKLKNHPPLKMHSSDNIINYSSTVSNLVAVFKSLNYEADLKCASVLNDALSKLPPNLKESWSMHTVKKHWLKPTLLDFNEWLKEKAEAHDRMKVLNIRGKVDDSANVQRLKTSTINFSSHSQKTERKCSAEKSISNSI